MVRAILFDKDGTLTDFRATWEAWMAGFIHELADASGTAPAEIADVYGFDLATNTIPPHAPFVTAPGEAITASVARAIGWTAGGLDRWIAPRVRRVEQVPVVGGVETLARLSAAGLTLGVLTNADVAEAERHLSHMGALPHVARIIGCDSGFGAKPDPRGAADFAAGIGLDPGDVLLVGDGMTDMAAAKGAGLRSIGVLTGTLGHADLAPHAEAVLPDLTHLPDYLGLARG
ncbi:HAD family hydrolase [Jannaschia marina]|uniref:HAD family hydrolase n=1 Tax=Jannaschia marina TaxID=2741674 RepID=UPI0015C97B61|nr:HAD family hydrolase [Jannaschia marina]